MAKFKVGDIVVAKSNTPYTITTDGWIGRVVMIRDSTERERMSDGCYARDGETIKVENIEDEISCTSWVNPYYFDKYNKDTKETKKMTKFRVGDIIRGNKKANRYGVTVEGWTGWVLEVDEESNKMVVAGENMTPGGRATVCMDCFDLIRRRDMPGTLPEIKEVIFNEPATIVIWADDIKTIVKCGENEKFDPEKGLALCIAKRTLGNRYNYYEPFKKWLGKYEKKKKKKATPKPETKKSPKKATKSKK